MTQNVMLHKAKIATLGERVEDTFYITEKDGERIIDPARIKQLCQQLEEKIDLFSQAH
jgi:[protein-PII] uridylyltransferase